MLAFEALTAAGIDGWQGLAEISSARLTWDVDVMMPDLSHNLVARIPGVESTQAVVLSGQLDSPDSPGALDNGSGSPRCWRLPGPRSGAVDASVDVYLVWLGAPERPLRVGAFRRHPSGTPRFAPSP